MHTDSPPDRFPTRWWTHLSDGRCMKVASTHTYAAPAAVVFAMMTTPDVLTQKYTALGHSGITILEHSTSGTTVAVRSRRTAPMDVPGFAKRFCHPPTRSSNTTNGTHRRRTAPAPAPGR